MATVFIPALLRPLAGGAATVEAQGDVLRDVLQDLDRQHPGILDRVVENGAFRPEVFVAIGGEEAFGLDAPVPANAEVHILPATAGGAL
jgi:molybdopterin converting factor small subunit